MEKKPSPDFPYNPLACVPDRSDECDHRGSGSERRTTMKTFTIEVESNNITAHATKLEAEKYPRNT